MPIYTVSYAIIHKVCKQCSPPLPSPPLAATHRGGSATLLELEWIHVPLGHVAGRQRIGTDSTRLPLIINAVALNDTGEYLCRAKVSGADGQSFIVGPQSAGNLTVIGEAAIETCPMGVK